MERKLTDKEIVKAYEHCYVNKWTCKSCCLSDDDKPCVSHEDVLDLINRQKEELETLKEERENMQAVIFALEEEKRELKKENAKVISFNDALYREKQQAVKDTAKEICLKIIKGQPQPIQESWADWFKKEYGVEVE